MPDLGRYAVNVLAAYGVGLAVIAVIVALTLWQARSARRALDQAERDG